jgi:hypothetical protein
MSRGPRRTIDEKINSVKEQIAGTQIKLNKLNKELNELIKEKQQTEISDIYNLMQNTGISTDKLKEMIQEEIQNPSTAYYMDSNEVDNSEIMLNT